jgi:serine/threonine-protein kinase
MSEAESQTPSDFVEGTRVGENYELVEQLGVGSMGVVWKARHLKLGHMVAIKFLRQLAEDAMSSGRFDREGRLCARLSEQSRHIVRVTDLGHFRSTPYVVMELLKGETLASRLGRTPALPLELVARITTHLCRAVRVAHEAGVIHRDIKPANVFLCETPSDQELLVKLLDFGIAKMTVEDSERQATRVGLILGTPAYMSPEQVGGEELDGRSDLWSIAALVYRMSVGKSPFGSGTLGELALRITSMNARPPSAVNADLSPELDAWMARGLSRDKAERFATAMELSDALNAVARVVPEQSIEALRPSTAVRKAGTSEIPIVEERPSGPLSAPTVAEPPAGVPRAALAPRKVGPWAAAAAVVVVLAGLAVSQRARGRGAAVDSPPLIAAAAVRPPAPAALATEDPAPPATPKPAPAQGRVSSALELPAAPPSSAPPAPSPSPPPSAATTLRPVSPPRAPKPRSAKAADSSQAVDPMKRATDQWNQASEL